MRQIDSDVDNLGATNDHVDTDGRTHTRSSQTAFQIQPKLTTPRVSHGQSGVIDALRQSWREQMLHSHSYQSHGTFQVTGGGAALSGVDFVSSISRG